MKTRPLAMLAGLLLSGIAHASVLDGTLGSPCTTSNDCVDGLGCSLPSSHAAGPPGGLCTTACLLDATCKRYADSGTCQGGYCYEGCSVDTTAGAEFDPGKCHGRDDVACTPVICIDDRCRTHADACIPRCASDEQCESGFFCHTGSGLCHASPAEGAPPGSACEESSNSCLGICAMDPVPLALSDSTSYHCVEPCVIGAPLACGGSNAASRRACIGNFFDSDIRGGHTSGDLGACVPLCNCSSECADEEVCARVELGDGFDERGVCAYGPRPTGADCLGDGGAAGSEHDCPYGPVRACQTSECLGVAACLPDGSYAECECIDAGASDGPTHAESPERRSVAGGCSQGVRGARGEVGASVVLGFLLAIGAAATRRRAGRRTNH